MRVGATTSSTHVEDDPVRLPVVGESAAGQSKAYALSPGQAVKIMTGAPMPAGADVGRPDRVDRRRSRQRVDHAGCRSPASTCGRAARTSGPDELLLVEGTRVGPRQAAILAATGHASVQARPRPRIVVLSTGSELREPGTSLGFDSIYDSNSFAHRGRGAPGRRHRLPGRHRAPTTRRSSPTRCPTSSCAPTWW